MPSRFLVLLGKPARPGALGVVAAVSSGAAWQSAGGGDYRLHRIRASEDTEAVLRHVGYDVLPHSARAQHADVLVLPPGVARASDSARRRVPPGTPEVSLRDALEAAGVPARVARAALATAARPGRHAAKKKVRPEGRRGAAPR